jgi:L-ascorbate metabolism protein UlaG (beta-lactamase superfamily)
MMLLEKLLLLNLSNYLKGILILAVLIAPFSVLAQYKNTNGIAIDKPFSDLLKWQRNQKDPLTMAIDISSEWKSFNLHKEDNYSIWIGHSTFLIKKNGLIILTDPIFSQRASPFKMFGPKRLIPPAIDIKELPNIDVITISHNHYDHLDISSLEILFKLNPNIIFLIPMGDKNIFDKRNIKNVYEFEWWESKEIKNIKFTFTPVQHWSARGLFDKNDSLWGGWYYEDSDYSIYHAGDTGYSNDFVETKSRLGSPKYSFIPIGAYEPEWFMAASHVNPEDAIQIMLDLESEYSFGMHWATFTLTDEDTIEPKIRLKKALEKANLNNFSTLMPGEVIRLE